MQALDAGGCGEVPSCEDSIASLVVPLKCSPFQVGINLVRIIAYSVSVLKG